MLDRLPTHDYYIAGPMRGYPRFNFDAFFEAEANLQRFGYVVVNPARLDLDEGRTTEEAVESGDLSAFDLEEALRQDFYQVITARGVILLPGWEASSGVAAELFVAEQSGREIHEYHPGDRPGEWRMEEYDAKARGKASEAKRRHDVAATQVNGEVRVTNATTGGQKGQKLARYDLVPSGPLWQLAELYGRGAAKYEDRNWEKGYNWSLSYAALNRHLHLFWQGEDTDKETGCAHLASVVFHAFALLQFGVTHPELDDRP